MKRNHQVEWAGEQWAAYVARSVARGDGTPLVRHCCRVASRSHKCGGVFRCRGVDGCGKLVGWCEGGHERGHVTLCSRCSYKKWRREQRRKPLPLGATS